MHPTRPSRSPRSLTGTGRRVVCPEPGFPRNDTSPRRASARPGRDPPLTRDPLTDVDDRRVLPEPTISRRGPSYPTPNPDRGPSVLTSITPSAVRVGDRDVTSRAFVVSLWESETSRHPLRVCGRLLPKSRERRDVWEKPTSPTTDKISVESNPFLRLPVRGPAERGGGTYGTR